MPAVAPLRSTSPAPVRRFASSVGYLVAALLAGACGSNDTPIFAEDDVTLDATGSDAGDGGDSTPNDDAGDDPSVDGSDDVPPTDVDPEDATDADPTDTDPTDADPTDTDVAVDADDADVADTNDVDPSDTPDAADIETTDDATVDTDTTDIGGDVDPVPWTRPSNATCFAGAAPSEGLGITTTPAFPGVSFSLPIALLQAPDASDWYVGERSGRILRFADDASVTSDDVVVFADLRDRVDDGDSETGLLGVAFAPDYATSRQVFVSYTGASGGRYQSTISRFDVIDGVVDGSSELRILRFPQPAWNHNGGDIHFGPDGMLYASFGDGGGAGDTYGHGQNADTIFGTIVRLDVSAATVATPYRVPADNPFVGGGGAPEIWAWGLRNPWRFAFGDTVEELWVADVGQNAWEEVNLVRGGGNYGWPVYEGFHCYASNPSCGLLAAEDPVVEYSHAEGRSITGGVVVDSAELPTLDGAFIFGDFVSGTIWAVHSNGSGGWERHLVTRTALGLSSFGEAHDGRVFALDYFGGGVHELVPDLESSEGPAFLLSETGCVDPSNPWEPAAGTIPYGLRAPFWSDGAEKTRWFALPDGASVEVGADGDMEFPIGSVLAKRFELDGERVETRLLVRHDDGTWAGYSYRWNEAQDDAQLLPAGGSREVGGTTWSFPSRAECLSCHTAAAGRALGPEVDQFHGVSDLPLAGVADQLATFRDAGVVSGAAVAAVPMADVHDDASLDVRARSWLHSNCAMCHQPDGPGRADFDVRLRTEDIGLCDVVARDGLGVDGALLIDGVDADASVLVQRIDTRGASMMPPLGSNVVDSDGVALIRAWIASGACAD